MAEKIFDCERGKNEVVEAECVNIIYISLCDTHSNKNYKAKCVCGHLFNIDIYISGLFLEEMKKDLNKFVTKQNNGCSSIMGTIHKTLGIHFDKNASYLNVSWKCAKCADKITLIVTRFF
jgi:hypothetical protein